MKIILIDFGDVFYRTLYNEQIVRRIAKYKSFESGVYFLLQKFLSLLKWLGGEQSFLMICKDSHPSWRSQLASSYKGKRRLAHFILKTHVVDVLTKYGFPQEDLNKEFFKVSSKIEDFFRNYNVPILQYKGYEADDLLALVVQSLDDFGKHEFIIFGADSDLLQLVSPNVKVLRFVKGQRVRMVTWENVKYVLNNFFFKKMDFIDLVPQHLVWLKVALGDKSDQIPSLIKGLGKVFWYKFFREVGIDPFLFQYTPESIEVFLEKVREFCLKEKRNVEFPSIEKVYSSMILVSLQKDNLMKHNSDSFILFKNDLKKIKESISILDLEKFSDGLRRYRDAVSKLWKKVSY